MKKVISLFVFSLVFHFTFSQTLQSVTDLDNKTSNALRVTGSNNLIGGPALELYYHEGRGSVVSHDRQTNQFKPLYIEALTTSILNGNVGIGTTSPAYKLDVNGAIRAMNNVALKRDNVDNGIELQTEAFSSYMNIQASNSGFNSAKNLSLNAYGGNVGIGTVTPVYKLDINGGFRSGDNGSNFLYNGYADVIMSAAGRGNGGRAFVHGEGNRLVMNYGGDFSGGTEIGRFIYFSETGGVSYINTGNVGIGTLDPGSYKLAVEGTIGTRKIKVTQETWADYVFDSSYQLPSLTHVETFVKENKHLPEVPSAAEVKKDGLDLGDNQVLLLKKIEELTLYIIQQNKKMEQMEKRMTEMEAKSK